MGTDPGSRDLSIRRGQSLARRTSPLISRGLQDIERLKDKGSQEILAQVDNIRAAAANGDISAIRRILDRDPSKVDQRDEDEWTPLHVAVCHDQPMIYADLPWSYNDKQAVKGEFGTGTGAAEVHYARPVGLTFSSVFGSHRAKATMSSTSVEYGGSVRSKSHWGWVSSHSSHEANVTSAGELACLASCALRFSSCFCQVFTALEVVDLSTP